MKVSVAIVTFNSVPVIGECLSSLKSQNYEDFEILIYDNASSDNTCEVIEDLGKGEIKLIKGSYNRGFGFALNRLAEFASGEIIASLNPDTVVDKDWITRAVANFEDKDVGMVSSRVLYRDNPDYIDSAGHLICPDGLNRGRGHNKKISGDILQKTEVAFPSGSAGFYRRDLFLKLGGIDESLFLFGDDTDIGIKFQLAGYRCIYEPDSVVYHAYSYSTGRYSDIKAYFVERNRLQILFKYFPVRLIGKSVLYTLKRVMYHNLSAIMGSGDKAHYLKNGSIFRLYGLMLMAYMDAAFNLRETLRKRSELCREIDIRRTEMILDKFSVSAREVALSD
ncbi:MAG: glycosyltransferase family 2 protein [Deltaproteobacteria bacterium]|nr:glycosyltransferase family 2 protein [Deltaproteobacteria bacterium]